MGDCRMLLWHDREEVPRKGKYTIVKKDNKFYLDYIGENFDDWADDVEQWAYVFYSPTHTASKNSEKEDQNVIKEETSKPNIYIDHINVHINDFEQHKGTSKENADDNSSMPNYNDWSRSWDELYKNLTKIIKEKYTDDNMRRCCCDCKDTNDEKHSSKPRSISGAEKECYLTVWRSVLERWEHGTIIFPLNVVRRLNCIFTYLDSGRGEYIPWNTIDNWDD